MTAALPEPESVETLVRRLDEPGDWDTYVATHPDATAYHYWRWREVFQGALGQTPCYLAAYRTGRCVGVLPIVLFSSRLFGSFAVSLPFVNYGGVVADDPNAAASLLDAAIAVARDAGARFLELRHRRRTFRALAARQHKVAMVLPLAETAEEQWRRVGKKVRNQVRKAEKSGLTVTIGGPELVPAFYDVFAHNMRDLGTPVYGRALFDTVTRLDPDETRCCVVRAEGRPAAASIVVGHRGDREVPWASSLRVFNPRCANMLLYWTMLRDAIEAGCGRFDFGRSSPDASTYTFKRQWAPSQPRSSGSTGRMGARCPTSHRDSGRFRLATAVVAPAPGGGEPAGSGRRS